MRLSLFTVVDGGFPGQPSLSDRLVEVERLAVAADAAGLDALWIAEHHFDDGGRCPQPAVLLAALARRTSTLRLGVLVSVLPFHAPLEVAEQYALVDELSGGRLNLGLGSGYLPNELAGFGVDAASKRERFDRGYDLVLAALRGEEVRDAGGPVRLNVRPRQRPHPPVWIAVQRREAIPFVARRGANLALIPYATVASRDELAEEIREYRAARTGPAPGTVSVGVHVYVGESPEEARAALHRYIESRLAHGSTHLTAAVADDPKRRSVATIEAMGFALFGARAKVREGLAALAAIGVDEVLALVDFGGLPTSRVEETVRALGELRPALS